MSSTTTGATHLRRLLCLTSPQIVEKGEGLVSVMEGGVEVLGESVSPDLVAGEDSARGLVDAIPGANLIRVMPTDGTRYAYDDNNSSFRVFAVVYPDGTEVNAQMILRQKNSDRGHWQTVGNVTTWVADAPPADTGFQGDANHPNPQIMPNAQKHTIDQMYALCEEILAQVNKGK